MKNFKDFHIARTGAWPGVAASRYDDIFLSLCESVAAYVDENMKTDQFSTVSIPANSKVRVIQPKDRTQFIKDGWSVLRVNGEQGGYALVAYRMLDAAFKDDK